MPNDIPSAPLISTAELLEKSLRRFGTLFSVLFPWLVVSCIGGLLLALAGEATTIWALALGIIGVCVLLISYVAIARITSGVEKEPKDIIANGRASLKLFPSYLWIIILEAFIFVGSSLLIIPVIIFSIYIAISPYVLVVENLRGIKALTRSWSYVSGRWWATLWRTLVFIFLVVIAILIIGTILGLIVTPAALSAGSIPGVPMQQPFGLILIQQIIDAFLFLPIALCFLYELYADLSRTKPSLPGDVSATATSEEKTAFLWLTVFLVIGLALAFIWIFFTVGHPVASAGGFRYHFGRYQ
jgi:hypothetical protein